MKRRFVRKRAFDEARKIVYHSHHASVLNSHRTHDTQRTKDLVAYLVGRSNYRATLHGRSGVLSADDNFHTPGAVVAGHALIQNLDQSRLFFKGPKELVHPFRAGKLGLGENVGRAVKIDLSRSFILTLEAALA